VLWFMRLDSGVTELPKDSWKVLALSQP
jgi:hypothetical protein